MKALTFILGVVLTAYCAAGTLSETLWQGKVEVDRVLCRFFVCINTPLELRARQQLAGVSKEDVHEAIAIFRELVQGDPQNPYRWADLGEAFLEGRPDAAVSAWAQHSGARAGDYRKSNYIFNGNFEFEPTHHRSIGISDTLRALMSPVTARPVGRGTAHFASASRVRRILTSRPLRSWLL